MSNITLTKGYQYKFAVLNNNSKPTITYSEDHLNGLSTRGGFNCTGSAQIFNGNITGDASPQTGTGTALTGISFGEFLNDVTIGTTAGTNIRLHVKDTSGGHGYNSTTFGSANSGTKIAKFEGDSDDLIIQNINSGDYWIGNTGQNNGIAIFDGPDGVRMTYNGNASVRFDSTYAMHIQEDSANLSESYIAKFENTSTNTTTSDGIIVECGPNSNPNANIKFIRFSDGDGTYLGAIQGTGAGGVSYTSSSDRKLKKNIKNTSFTIKDLMKLSVRDFNWKSTSKFDTGLIAQEVESIYPNVVSKPVKSDEHYTIDYGKLTPLLIKAVQDQHEMIKNLEKRIKKLEND